MKSAGSKLKRNTMRLKKVERRYAIVGVTFNSCR